MSSIRELLDKGVPRNEMAAELVRWGWVSGLLEARFIIAISLGEIRGDVLGPETCRDPLYFVNRLAGTSKTEPA